MDAILQYEQKLEDDFYFILGCDELSTTEQIVTEYKLRALDCHPDKHLHDPTAGDKFAKLQEAKQTLTDPAERKQYDAWRKSGIAIPYRDWQARRQQIHSSMHWASEPKKEPMLDNVAAQDRPSVPSHGSGFSTLSDWRGNHESDILRKFRNYEI